MGRHTAVRMLCHFCLHPTVGHCVQEMVSFQSKCQLYLLDIEDGLRGKPFLEACRHFPSAVLIGVKHSKQNKTTKHHLVLLASCPPVLTKTSPDLSHLNDPSGLL